MDFCLLPIIGITEPEALPWFTTTKFSAGKLLAFLWGLFGLFITMSFNSVFRAMLITNEYEKPVETIYDVTERGQSIYVPIELTHLR